MKYSEQYSDLKVGEISADNKVTRVLKKDNCMVCGDLTNFVRIDMDAPLCSDDCFNRIKTSDDGGQ